MKDAKAEGAVQTARRAKLLIVERKLISNRGHHHTQIAALTSLFPDHDVSLVVGEGYDGFLGVAAKQLDGRNFKLARLRTRLRYGTLPQRISAIIGMIKARRASLPVSGYGQSLAEVCQRIDLGPNDLIVIPTAELDSLESVRELWDLLGPSTPRIWLRFLSPQLGEQDELIRECRLREATAQLPDRIVLFSETEELAAYLRDKFGISIRGGFFLPCSMQIECPSQKSLADRTVFRIGIFGPPRLEKGSHRIASIVEEVKRRNEPDNGRRFEFVIQGAEEEFRNGGVYSGLAEFFEGKDGVLVSPSGDRLPPHVFRDIFASVDAILLPYDTSIYGLQGSGVVQDAVAARKPIIHTEGMSMNSFLRHGNAIAATTDLEFANAIHKMAEEHSSFLEGASRAAVACAILLWDSDSGPGVAV
ncbi:hypothetical protein J2046_001799 [Rhizobium petrolearium]|uniref:hypothetical protein n=1 Tax=Neorhizobium petrolearium TaxID=515361 RepID=UPI001AE2739F|nr:hypothetical protein [Neorhizobium petrolearium]MBP1843543.1 hypothetical protein [Neorhizobium petrolearium]